MPTPNQELAVFIENLLGVDRQTKTISKDKAIRLAWRVLMAVFTICRSVTTERTNSLVFKKAVKNLQEIESILKEMKGK